MLLFLTLVFDFSIQFWRQYVLYYSPQHLLLFPCCWLPLSSRWNASRSLIILNLSLERIYIGRQTIPDIVKYILSEVRGFDTVVSLFVLFGLIWSTDWHVQSSHYKYLSDKPIDRNCLYCFIFARSFDHRNQRITMLGNGFSMKCLKCVHFSLKYREIHAFHLKYMHFIGLPWNKYSRVWWKRVLLRAHN